MVQTRAYEFMVQYTPQREWIEGRGILIWLALFFIELGAGMFIVSSILGSLLGMLIGWLICAILGGGLHLLYLGHPIRFWRILISTGWKTSWISRGLYFTSFFLILGFIHMCVTWWASPSLGLLIGADVFAFCAIVYGGFVMNFVNAIQIWNSALLPVIFAMSGIWGGIGLTIVLVSVAGDNTVMVSLEGWTRLFLIGFIIILIIYLLSIRYSGSAGKISVRDMVVGKWAILFWVMIVTLGLALPLIVVLLSWVGVLAVSHGLLYTLIFFELLGDVSLRYCILRCGYYNPVIPTTNYFY